MGRIKGAAIRARLEYLRSRYGEDALEALLDAMDPLDRVVLSGTVLPSIWYPFQVLSSLDAAAQHALAAGNDELFDDAGEQAARQHARGIYRVFSREVDPARVLKLASCIFSDYFSGLGRVSVKPAADGASCRMSVAGASVSSRSHCLTTMGYFRGVLSACTSRHASSREVRCRSWGDDACEFEFSWPPPLENAVGA